MQGVICSGIGYYVSGVVMKDRGPVFVTAFNPLCMIIVAIMGSFLLSEIMYLGRCLSFSLYNLHPCIRNNNTLINNIFILIIY